LNGRTYDHEFVIAGVSEPGILGIDFLRKYRCYWDWGRNTLEIDGEEIKCRVPVLEEIPSVEVYASKNYTVPPQTEMIIEGELHGKLNSVRVGLVTGNEPFMRRRKLGVASVLARQQHGRIPVRIINPGHTQRTIDRDDRIASLQAVEVITSEDGKCRATQVTPPKIWSDEMEELYRRSCERIPEQQEELRTLLEDYEDIFAAEGKPLGRTNLVQHTISTGTNRPIKQPPRREPLGKQVEVQEELQAMLEQGVIEPSSSPWASPIVLVKKKDGSTRFCIDYRRLNAITDKDAYPLPRIDDNLDALTGSRWFSTLDLASGYWQVAMHPDDKPKTAFCTRYGLYQWRVMPFGLCNAPSTFERLMEQVLTGLQWEVALLYLDDVIVFSTDLPQHLQRLRMVFDRIRSAHLQLKPKKCHLFKSEVSFLGHVVSAEGVTTEENKINTVRDWPVPNTVKAIRAFLGLTGYYRRFIEGYAEVAAPMVALTKKHVRFNWTTECQEAFETLKKRLITAPILKYPDPECPFILDTDASKCSVGAVLSQVQDGQEVVIAYGSRTMSKSERNYCVTRQELLAIVWFTEHFKHYLMGQKFLLRTDHGSLRWMFKEPEGQMARWLERPFQLRDPASSRKTSRK
jgi:hypothetical protein